MSVFFKGAEFVFLYNTYVALAILTKVYLAQWYNLLIVKLENTGSKTPGFFFSDSTFSYFF